MDHIYSICTGIGGLDLGLHAGLRAVGRSPRTVCMVEREAFCCAVLGKAMHERRLDRCPVWCGDLRNLPVEQLPWIDWITGGYPCQPFSQAGKRLGEDDPRHLWPVIREQVRALQPRGVFFENVAGHLTLGLDRVLQDLAGCGFRCAFGLFTAAEVGAPHRRERVFILGLADPNIYGQPSISEHEEAPRMSGVLAESGFRGCGQTAHRFPAPPNSRQRADEPPRTTQPGLGRDADGLPDRVDRLRALGNAVVPQQAGHAFVRLWNLLT